MVDSAPPWFQQSDDYAGACSHWPTFIIGTAHGLFCVVCIFAADAAGVGEIIWQPSKEGAGDDNQLDDVCDCILLQLY